MIPLRFLSRVEKRPGALVKKDLAIITTSNREVQCNVLHHLLHQEWKPTDQSGYCHPPHLSLSLTLSLSHTQYRFSFLSGRDEAYDRVMYLWHRYVNRPVSTSNTHSRAHKFCCFVCCFDAN
jgi:hypothetical protein